MEFVSILALVMAKLASGERVWKCSGGQIRVGRLFGSEWERCGGISERFRESGLAFSALQSVQNEILRSRANKKGNISLFTLKFPLDRRYFCYLVCYFLSELVGFYIVNEEFVLF